MTRRLVVAATAVAVVIALGAGSAGAQTPAPTAPLPGTGTGSVDPIPNDGSDLLDDGDFATADNLSGGLLDDGAAAAEESYAVVAQLAEQEMLNRAVRAAAEEAKRRADARRKALAGVGEVPTSVRFAAEFNAAGAKHGIDPRLLASVATIESRFIDAVITCKDRSSAGAGGLMQFMPATARAYGINECDPVQSIDAAARYLTDAFDRYNSWDLAIASYNGGGAAVADGKVRSDVQGYVDKVNAVWNAFKEADRAVSTTPGAPGTNSRESPGGAICTRTVRNNIEVNCDIADRVDALIADAAAAGVELRGGGYRSSASQIAARKRNGCPDIYTAPASSCRVPTARPGQSMHERGLAIDFAQNGGTIGRSSSGFAWLRDNAARYGLFNLPSEAWHWSTNAK